MVETCWISIAACAALFVYPAVVYPALLALLARISPRPWRRAEELPSVTVLIAAHNEESFLEEKLRNTLAFDYPADRFDVIVVSDGSTDGTEDIARRFSPRVRLLKTGRRVGKQLALNDAVALAKADVLLLTDVGITAAPETLRQLVRNFADPGIGAVSASIRFPRRANNGEREYLAHDATLRRLESAVGSTTGCCGPLYAIRRACFVPFDASSASDFVSALDAVALGYRSVLDPDAGGVTRSAASYRGEFRRKVRTIVGGMETLYRWSRRPAGRRPALYLAMLFSHKIVRWLAPLGVPVAFVAAAVGAHGGDRGLFAAFVAMLAGGAVACLGLLWPTLARHVAPVRLLAFFLASCAAGITAWGQLLAGRRYVTWEPTQRGHGESTSKRHASAGR